MARQERALRTRRAVLVAAAEVFDETGYEAATISQILERSGVTKGALYFHFASKEELARGVLAEQRHALPEVPTRALKLQQLTDGALLLAHMLKSDPLLRGSIRLTLDHGVPQIGEARQVPMRAWEEFTRSVLQAADEAGELLPAVEIDSLARMIVGAFTGVQVHSDIMTGRADLPERVAELYRLLLTAVAVPGVLVRVDFDPARAAKVYEEAIAARTAQSAEQDDAGADPRTGTD
ncbi:ScbR family autoregulator-binding transcription factor [Streptomyces sp. WG-D5]